MVTYLDDKMVNTSNGRADAEASEPNGPNPPPPPTLAQAIASILESRDEHSELLRQLVANSAHGGNGARITPAPAPTTCSDFAATHPLLFTEARVPLEADHWLRVIGSMFGLLRYTEVQKTLFTAQQLCGDASVWWVNYTATHPVDYQVSWTKFHNTFCAHYIPVGVTRKKRQEFMNLKQGGRFVHDKKKNRFIIDLSTKLHECMELNTAGSFPEFISNVIITDDAIRTHKETKKRKVVAAMSANAPPRYWMVYHHAPT
jgi:hypothetical protein